MKLTENQIKELVYNAAEKLVKTFSRCDNRSDVVETNNHIQKMIAEYRDFLRDVKNKKPLPENKITKRLNGIDKQFAKLKLSQPYVIIERANNNHYYAYIENYDKILYANSDTIENAIGILNQKTKDWASKEITLLQNKNGSENKSRPIK